MVSISWNKVVAVAIGIFIIVFYSYLIYLRMTVPHYFVYEPDGNISRKPIINCSYTPKSIFDHEPNLDGNIEIDLNFSQKKEKDAKTMVTIDGKSCLVTNLPKGKNNVYLKESHPYMYWISTNQLAFIGWFTFLIVFTYIIKGEKK